MPQPRVTSTFLSIICFAALAGCKAPEPKPDFRPMATVRDLMTEVIDPNADGVWESVATVVTPEGTEERAPKTDEEWKAVRRHTLALLEASNLLLIPGRSVAKSHEKSEAPGIELEPEQIQAMIEKDRATWTKYAHQLQDSSLAVLKAIEAKDADTVMKVSGEIDLACESCHRHYWYPNDKGPPPHPDEQ
jgi:hypothetical protein